jgi:hypothetical protein
MQPRVPGSIITASVFLFIYGALLLFCGVCGGASVAIQPKEDPMGLKAAMDKEAPGHELISYGGIATNVLFGMLFLASGVGVLRLVNFFRILAYLACAGILLTTAGSTILTALYIFPVQQRIIMQQMQNPNQPPMPFDMNMVMSGSLALGILITIGAHLFFCGFIAIPLSMKSARDAFAGIVPESDDPYSRRRRPRERDDDRDDFDDGYGEPKTPRSPGDTGITDRGQ